MSKISNCWEDQGATFHREVKLNDLKLATIRQLTPLDLDVLMPLMKREKHIEFFYTRAVMLMGGNVNGINYNFGKLEGWEFDKEITVENLNLLKKEYREKILKDVEEMINEYVEKKEAIAKN